MQNSQNAELPKCRTPNAGEIPAGRCPVFEIRLLMPNYLPSLLGNPLLILRKKVSKPMPLSLIVRGAA